MLTNDQMKPNRYGIMMKYKRMYEAICEIYKSGRKVMIATHTKATIYPSLDWFKLGKTGVYVKRGKNWDCINFSAIKQA